MQSGQHIISLSLGTVAEPSAVAVVDPRTEFLKRDRENFFDVTHLERFPAGRPIPVIVARVEEIMSDKRLAKNCHLLLDITSTGEAPVRVFESRGLNPKLFDLTNAGLAERSGGVSRVPVRDVIGVAQIVQQTNRLQVAKDLELAPTLVVDLQSYDFKLAARGSDLRGGRNSDLVLALSVALWWADDLTWGESPTDRTPPVNYGTGPGAWMGH